MSIHRIEVIEDRKEVPIQEPFQDELHGRTTVLGSKKKLPYYIWNQKCGEETILKEFNQEIESVVEYPDLRVYSLK